jgi:predicted glycosyltransferase
MRIWFDVITPKQARLMSSIAKRLGREYVITVKGYSESVDILRELNVNFIQIGDYSIGDLKKKLISYAERVKLLSEFVLDYKPDFLISFSSPEAVRVAYGLSIRSITMNDSPHSYHVGRLTLPLSWKVVYPAAIPEDDMIRLGASRESLVPYRGVDEVAWVKDRLYDLRNSKREFKVFIRPEESGASYMLGKEGFTMKLVDEVIRVGADVIIKPRYESQSIMIREKYGKKVTILDSTVDTLDLFGRIVLVVTGGGTMAREAALLGTPSLCAFPLDVKLHVNDFLRDTGFPIWRASSLKEAISIIRMILRDPDSYVVDTRPLMEELEDPRVVIEKILNDN